MLESFSSLIIGAGGLISGSACPHGEVHFRKMHTINPMQNISTCADGVERGMDV